MTDAKTLLHGVPGGRVLDVATGRGNFVGFLLEGLASHDEIVGIDNDPEAEARFTDAFGDRPGVRFEQMNATALAFEDGRFDTVCVANSLHHFADPAAVLREMRRVCRPGGSVVVLEMCRDGQAEPQLTHVELHHWWAAIDTLDGKVHRETFPRAEVMGLIASLGLSDLRVDDIADTETDPMSHETAEELDPVIDRYIGLADGHPDLQARGEELRRRLHDVGFLVATSVFAVGRT